MKAIISGVAAAWLACGSANATEIRFAHFLPVQHPLHVEFEAWAKKINEESGTLNFTFYPGGQLGAPNDHYDMAKSSIADLAWIGIGYTPGRFPIAELLDVPFAIPGDPQVATRSLNEWYADYSGKEMADVHLCFVHLMPTGYLHTQKEVKTPDEATGLRIRPASAAVAAYFTQLGNTTVPLPVTEAQQALERGVANSISLAYHSIVLYGIDKSVKYHLDLPLYYPGGALVMNKAKYESLTGNEKEVMDKYCSGDGAVLATEGWHKWEAEGRELLEKAGGHNFYKPTDDEAKLWAEAGKPILDQWRGLVNEAGYNADELLDDLYTIIDGKK